MELSRTPNQIIPLGNACGHGSTMLAERIRSNIVRLREDRKWSRPDLGKRLKPPTSGQQIERLEKGLRDLSPNWIERISRAFGVDPIALVAENGQTFEFTPQAADEVANLLARFVLRGDEPDPEIAQGLSILIQEMSALFARHPQARHDALAARLAVDTLARQHVSRT
jgi:transcriptional regulator with XRE-family HTH domain